MSKIFDFSDKLDFSDIDLTAPNVVIEEILSQLPGVTQGIVYGSIQPYKGHVFSYKKSGFSGIAEALGTSERKVDIQEDLGKFGEETHKFECFVYTPEYTNYKYRLFFVKYDIAHYPVNLILDESVARSISQSERYIYTCDNREELEDLVYKIFNSKRLIAIMQELIRINQAKKEENQDQTDAESE